MPQGKERWHLYQQFEYFFEIAINIINKTSVPMPKIEVEKQKTKEQLGTQHVQEQPITPKKKPQHRQISQTSANRLKFRYTIIEKPHTSKFGYLFMFIWMLMIIAIGYNSYNEKLKNFENKSTEQFIQCREDYEKNKCEKGLKATLKYCEEKRRCFEGTVEDIYQQKVRISFIVGEIVKDFVQGIGLIVTVIMLVIFWLFSRRNAAKETKKQYVEYYN